MRESRLLNLAAPQLLFLVAIILVPLLGFIVAKPALARAYYSHVAPSHVENAWGFASAVGENNILVVASVQPGGAFAAAGLRPGAVPADVSHGNWQFYSQLACAKPRESLSLRFLQDMSAPAPTWVSLVAPDSTGAWCFF